ncbi:MAG: hypothetical protein R3F59_38300 [Myxococcota bacterium]
MAAWSRALAPFAATLREVTVPGRRAAVAAWREALPGPSRLSVRSEWALVEIARAPGGDRVTLRLGAMGPRVAAAAVQAWLEADPVLRATDRVAIVPFGRPRQGPVRLAPLVAWLEGRVAEVVVAAPATA